MGIIKTRGLVHDFIRRDEEDNVESITTALDHVDLDIKEGQFIGLLEGKVRFTADTLYDCVDKIAHELEGKTCITAYCGEELSGKEEGRVEKELDMLFSSDTDVTVIHGGQPVYTLIISAE